MILDLFSRRVVGWKLGESLEVEVVVMALKNALSLRSEAHEQETGRRSTSGH